MPAVAGASAARKPTKLKILRGTLNTTRANKKEPAKGYVMEDPPKHLSPSQLVGWRRFAKLLATTQITTEDDFMAFELMVVLWSQWQQVQDDLRDIYKREGTYSYETESRTGGIMKRIVPELSAAGDLERRLLPLLGRFGMTPADRSRVSVIGDVPGQRQNPEDEFT